MARITVVNDQRDFLEVMREILTAAGHQVTALNGDGVGIDDLVETRPNLLVIDLRLDAGRSRVTGWDLLVLARADRRLQQVPVILCSADHTGAKVHADELQALTDVHLLLKPFGIAEVEELVDQLLDRSKSLPKPAPPAQAPAPSPSGGPDAA